MYSNLFGTLAVTRKEYLLSDNEENSAVTSTTKKIP